MAPGCGSGARTTYATDPDGDGDTDFVGGVALADEIAWWENDGSEGFAKHVAEENCDGAWSVYAADIDSDGAADLLGAARTGHEIPWWDLFE